MVKILYLTLKEFDDGLKDGVVKKIMFQVNCLKAKGFRVDYSYILKKQKEVHFVSDDKDIVVGKYKKMSGIFGKIILFKYLEDRLKEEKYNGCYIRHLSGRTDPWSIDIYRCLKQNGVKSLLEIPTYPYDKEGKWWNIVVDKIYRKKLSCYIDRIVTYSSDLSIYNIDTIRIKNGIDVKQVEMISNEKDDISAGINLVAVARFMIGHGYSRIIEGLEKYYSSKPRVKIYLHLVGDGPEKQLYEKLVKEKELEEYVIFYGQKSGKELDEIYNNSDVALGSFECYKKNIYLSSSLKMREYLAKGLPMISGCKEDAFDGDPRDFYLEYPNDDSSIDIDEIRMWYEDLRNRYDKKALIKEIRKYAEETIDISVTFAPVIKYLIEGE